MFDYTTWGGGIVAAVVIAWAGSKFARPAQKQTELQQLLGTMIQSAASTPALVQQCKDLLTANAVLQQTILDQKNTIETLTDRLAALERQVGDLTALAKAAELVPGLEAENAALRGEIRARDREIDRLNIEINAALQAQERAEGGLRATRQTILDIAGSDCPPQNGDGPPFQGPASILGAESGTGPEVTQ